MPNTGRMIVSLAGQELTAEEKVMLQHPMLAGIILFEENYKSRDKTKQSTNKEKLRVLISEIQSIADLPIFVDQEGGFVQRFDRGFFPLPAPIIFGMTYDRHKKAGIDMANECGSIMAAELAEFGAITLAPVCDLNGGNKAITPYGRAFHSEPKACSELLFAFTDGMRLKGMPATGKHFPGHGQDNGDTHNQVVKDHRTLAEIEANDLIPFMDLIKADRLAAIMPAHIVYTQVDPDHTAGSSKIWLEDILRKKYGFKGVIVSDCLSMKGAGDNGLLDKTEQALAFGDVAIMCHKTPAEIIPLLDALQEKGYALSAEGQARFTRWVDGSTPVRKELGMKFKAV